MNYLGTYKQLFKIIIAKFIFFQNNNMFINIFKKKLLNHCIIIKITLLISKYILNNMT